MFVPPTAIYTHASALTTILNQCFLQYVKTKCTYFWYYEAVFDKPDFQSFWHLEIFFSNNKWETWLHVPVVTMCFMMNMMYFVEHLPDIITARFDANSHRSVSVRQILSCVFVFSSSSCVPCVASFSGLSIFIGLSVISNVCLSWYSGWMLLRSIYTAFMQSKRASWFWGEDWYVKSLQTNGRTTPSDDKSFYSPFLSSELNMI